MMPLTIKVETTPHTAECLDCGIGFRITDLAYSYIFRDSHDRIVGECYLCPTCAEDALADEATED
jgi:hypothetical protein